MSQEVIDDEHHRNELLSKLARQQRDGILCDIVLVIRDREFPAHKSVLAASSEYFMALFATTMMEKNCSSIQLDLCPGIIQDVLHYMYTGVVILNESNVKDLIVAADYLLVSDLKQRSVKYLCSIISKINCVSIYKFAVYCNCSQLKQDATKVIRNHFALVSRTDEFLNVDFELLKQLVSDEEIIVTAEEEVYEAVLRWVKHKEETRKCHFENLFRSVNLFSMSKEYILDKIRTEPLVNFNKECMEFLVQSLKLFSVQEASKFDLRPRKCLEKVVPAMILTGGLCDGKSLKSTLAYFPERYLWRQLADMNSDRNEHAVVECGGFIYCIGGYPQGSSVERFDPLTNMWTQMTELMQRTFAPAAVSNDDCIYVLGGKDGFDAISTVQCYEPNSNTWSLGPNMSQARKALCAVVFRGDVYAIGGCVNDNYSLNTVEKLNLATQCWIKTSPMAQERKYASAAVVGDKILVIGGFQGTSTSALGSCEVYCPFEDQWSVVADLNCPRAAGGVARVETKVYVVGGRHNRRAVFSVESYDEENGKWIVEETVMPRGCAWFQCGMVKVRKTFLT